MSKKSKTKSLAASSKAVDPTLDALFASSAGPVAAPSKSRYLSLLEKKERSALQPKVTLQSGDEGSPEEDDEILSEIDKELHDSDSSESADESEHQSSDEELQSQHAADDALQQAVAATAQSKPNKERKRKRDEDNKDLESKYLAELVKDDLQPAEKRHRADGPVTADNEDKEDDDEDGDVPMHETLTTREAGEGGKTTELEKANRTVFLSNVSSDAISSKSAKKSLTLHLSKVLAGKEKIESIRFRSVAFSSASMPKRGAYATKALMSSTTKAANAYVVYPSVLSAREACSQLNGTQVLERHIRVDSVAHPSPTDHRRCVFVGNLGFVDDETMVTTNAEGETVEKKRTKTPSDVEEGLWRTFGKKGKVENVRVVRDPKTRVGKGFAYVQFYDANDVESALLLDGKRFPPMLPRALRVTRAKDPRKTALAQERSNAKLALAEGSNVKKSTKYKQKFTPEQQSAIGRAGKLFGRASAAQQRKGSKAHAKSGADGTQEWPSDMKTPEQVVFEGRRASSKDGRPKDLKFGKNGKKKGVKPTTRSAKRGADWKKKPKL